MSRETRKRKAADRARAKARRDEQERSAWAKIDREAAWSDSEDRCMECGVARTDDADGWTVSDPDAAGWVTYSRGNIEFSAEPGSNLERMLMSTFMGPDEQAVVRAT